MFSNSIISISELNKTYATGFQALNGINLEIKSGEILGLLGPNGAGKTTLINIICGITNLTSGKITVAGHDIARDYRKARAMIGLVPQELTMDAFETVWDTVSFSRGLFGRPKNPAYIENLLKNLSLWDKRGSRLMTLSGGMKRRVMIAKALSHEPSILFLDEPTAGVDVELRKSMWSQVRELRKTGVTVILTTHYIEEAEEMADRVGVINKGKLLLVEPTADLMKKLGKKELVLDLFDALPAIPSGLKNFTLRQSSDGCQLVFTYESNSEENQVADLIDHLKAHNIQLKDLSTRQSSLEEIFVQLVGEP